MRGRRRSSVRRDRGGRLRLLGRRAAVHGHDHRGLADVRPRAGAPPTPGSGAIPLPFLVPDRFPISPERAPLGVDPVPLRDPPALRPVADPFRPFDPAAGIVNLDHLVFVVQENRLFDHYFGTFPGADGIPTDRGRPKPCLPDPRPPLCVTAPTTTGTCTTPVVPTASLASRISIRGRVDEEVRARSA